jgi:hypothetical protein
MASLEKIYIYVFVLRDAPHRVHCFKGECWPADLSSLSLVFLSSTVFAGKSVADVSGDNLICGVASVGANVWSWDHNLRGKTGATGPGATFSISTRDV